MKLLFIVLLFVSFSLSRTAVSCAVDKTVRLGYLDQPGSALCLIAGEKGHYREEGLKVELISFSDSRSGLTALELGSIDAGAFEVGTVLTAIARGKEFRIIAGGGVPVATGPLADLDNRVQQKLDLTAIVVLIPATGVATEKNTATRLTAALIRAHRSRHEQPTFFPDPAGVDQTLTLFNPSPDYYRLERLWRQLDLQINAMPHDFLANHVYEEIYCDALDDLVDTYPNDRLLKELSGKVVCVPDCCPKNKNSK